MRSLLALALLALPCAAQFPPTLAMTYPGFPTPVLAHWVPGYEGRIQRVTFTREIGASEPCYGGGWGEFHRDSALAWIHGWDTTLGQLAAVSVYLYVDDMRVTYGVECTSPSTPLGVVSGNGYIEANVTFGYPLEEYPGSLCDNNWLGWGVSLVGQGTPVGWEWTSDFLDTFDGSVDWDGPSGWHDESLANYPPYRFYQDTNDWDVRQACSSMPWLPIYFVPTTTESVHDSTGQPINWGHGATSHWGGQLLPPVTLTIEYLT